MLQQQQQWSSDDDDDDMMLLLLTVLLWLIAGDSCETDINCTMLVLDSVNNVLSC